MLLRYRAEFHRRDNYFVILSGEPHQRFFVIMPQRQNDIFVDYPVDQFTFDPHRLHRIQINRGNVRRFYMMRCRDNVAIRSYGLPTGFELIRLMSRCVPPGHNGPDSRSDFRISVERHQLSRIIQRLHAHRRIGRGASFVGFQRII